MCALKFGRWEIEGDSANPEQPVLPDWGQLNSSGTGNNVPGDGWPFRVSEGYAIATRQHQPIEVGAVKMGT